LFFLWWGEERVGRGEGREKEKSDRRAWRGTDEEEMKRRGRQSMNSAINITKSRYTPMNALFAV